jgi:uncharacterized protein (TIGR03905 family)
MKKYFVAIALIVFCFFGCKSPNPVNETIIEKEMLTKDITFIPEGVCCQQMDISVVNDTIHSITFTKGCPGNALAISHLVEGMHIDSAIKKLDGITCRDKATSCPDQLARALKEMK